MPRHEPTKNRRSHRVGQIRSYLPRDVLTHHFVEGDVEGICVRDLEPTIAEALLEGGDQRLVKLERTNPAESIDEGLGQRATPRADFQNPRRFIAEEPADPLSDVGIHQEVRAEAAAAGSTHRSARFNSRRGNPRRIPPPRIEVEDYFSRWFFARLGEWRGEGLDPFGQLVRIAFVSNLVDDRRTYDDAIGNGRHLGDLVRRRDAETDGHR